MAQDDNAVNQQDSRSVCLNGGDVRLILAILFIVVLVTFAIWAGISSGKSNFYDGTINIDSQKNISFKSEKGEYSGIPKNVVIGVKDPEIKDGEYGCLETVEKYGREKYVGLYAGETCKEYWRGNNVRPVIVHLTS